MDMISTSGATPTNSSFCASCAPMMPATRVPWESQSSSPSPPVT